MQYIIATYISEQYQVKYFLLILTRVKVEGYIDQGINSISFNNLSRNFESKKKNQKSIGLGLIA